MNFDAIINQLKIGIQPEFTNKSNNNSVQLTHPLTIEQLTEIIKLAINGNMYASTAIGDIIQASTHHTNVIENNIDIYLAKMSTGSLVWYIMGKEMGNVRGYYEIACVYRHSNLEKAIEYFKKGMEIGDIRCIYKLGRLTQKPDEMIKYYSIILSNADQSFRYLDFDEQSFIYHSIGIAMMNKSINTKDINEFYRSIGYYYELINKEQYKTTTGYDFAIKEVSNSYKYVKEFDITLNENDYYHELNKRYGETEIINEKIKDLISINLIKESEKKDKMIKEQNNQILYLRDLIEKMQLNQDTNTEDNRRRKVIKQDAEKDSNMNIVENAYQY